VDLPETKGGANAFDLFDVVRNCVEAGAAGPFGFPATELIDQDDSIPKLGQVLEGQKIIMGRTGSAMEAEDGPLSRLSIGAIEEVESENLDIAFGGFHRTTLARNTSVDR